MSGTSLEVAVQHGQATVIKLPSSCFWSEDITAKPLCKTLQVVRSGNRHSLLSRCNVSAASTNVPSFIKASIEHLQHLHQHNMFRFHWLLIFAMIYWIWYNTGHLHYDETNLWQQHKSDLLSRVTKVSTAESNNLWSIDHFKLHLSRPSKQTIGYYWYNSRIHGNAGICRSA